MDNAAFSDSYSLPIGPGGAYAPPPYLYRGVKDIFIAYEADPRGVEALLPPGPARPPTRSPTCIAWARWVPFSTFGPYHEAYVMIRATLRGSRPTSTSRSSSPTTRSRWSPAARSGATRRSSPSWSATRGGGGAAVRRADGVHGRTPARQRIMTMSIACDRLADPAELEDVPVLSTRVIPNAEGGRRPSVAELVRLDVEAPLHKSADGTPKLWTGRASLTMDAHSPVDPWHLLAPTRGPPGLVRRLRLRPPPRQGRARLPGGRGDLVVERRGGGGGRGFLARALKRRPGALVPGHRPALWGI